MSSVNKVILLGNLGADPESRQLPDGGLVCNLRMATTEKWKDKVTGEPKELTEWHRVVLYRKLAETASQYLKKGASVFIEGQIRTRKWQDRDAVERVTTEIEASQMQMLGSRQSNASDLPHAHYSPKPPVNTVKNSAPWPGELDDVPF